MEKAPRQPHLIVAEQETDILVLYAFAVVHVVVSSSSQLLLVRRSQVERLRRDGRHAACRLLRQLYEFRDDLFFTR